MGNFHKRRRKLYDKHHFNRNCTNCIRYWFKKNMVWKFIKWTTWPKIQGKVVFANFASNNQNLNQDLNESFDFDLGECKKEVLNLVKNIGTSGTEVSLEKQSDVVSLGLNGKILDFPLVFRFQLAVGDEETVSKLRAIIVCI